MLPATLAVYEYLRSRKKSIGTSRLPDSIPKKHFNYIFSTLLLITAGVLTASLKNGWKSTYICPLQGYDFGFTVSIGILGLLLDFALALALGSLANCSAHGADGEGWQTSTLWGTILLVSSSITTSESDDTNPKYHSGRRSHRWDNTICDTQHSFWQWGLNYSFSSSILF